MWRTASYTKLKSGPPNHQQKQKTMLTVRAATLMVLPSISPPPPAISAENALSFPLNDASIFDKTVHIGLPAGKEILP
jgi:hypothetical protein